MNELSKKMKMWRDEFVRQGGDGMMPGYGELYREAEQLREDVKVPKHYPYTMPIPDVARETPRVPPIMESANTYPFLLPVDPPFADFEIGRQQEKLLIKPTKYAPTKFIEALENFKFSDKASMGGRVIRYIELNNFMMSWRDQNSTPLYDGSYLRMLIGDNVSPDTISIHVHSTAPTSFHSLFHMTFNKFRLGIKPVAGVMDILIKFEKEWREKNEVRDNSGDGN